MGRIFAFALMLLTATGCEDPWTWQPSGNAQPFQQASYECERDTRMSAASFGYGVMAQVYARDFAIRCMNQKGWYQQAVSTRPQPGSNASSTYDNTEIGIPRQVRPFPDRPDVNRWREKWVGCQRDNIAVADVERCAGPAPRGVEESVTELRNRHMVWEVKYQRCQARGGTPSATYTCSGAPPS